MVKTQLKVQPKVVVVGGSFAGLCAIRHLKGKADITLIEPHDFFEYTPGVLHLLAGSNAEDALVSPMTQCANGASILKGRFLGLNSAAQTVLVRKPSADPDSDESTEEVHFDALLICSGSPYTNPIRAEAGVTTYNERLEDIRSFTSKLRGAKNVLVAGGGLVGVELVAELSERLKSTLSSVTLISRSRLLASLPPASEKHAMNWLKKQKNVNVILEDVVSSSPTDGIYLTKKGRELQADIFIDCTFSKPIVSSLSEKAPDVIPALSTKEGAAARGDDRIVHIGDREALSPYTSKGRVLVDDNLKAIDFPSLAIFAAGDVVEHAQGVGFATTTIRSGHFGRSSRSPAVRNAHLAESQAEICAANVLRVLAARQAQTSSSSSASSAGTGIITSDIRPPMLRYPHDVFGSQYCPLLSCVSLGSSNAIIIFNNLVVGGAILGILGALVKFIIERTKVAEIRQHLWGRAFWALGHVVVNFLHCLHVIFHNTVEKLKTIQIPFIRSSSNTKSASMSAKI